MGNMVAMEPGAIVELIALIITILSIFGGVFVFENRKYRRRSRAEMAHIREHYTYLKGMATNTMQAMINVRVALEIQDSMVHRILVNGGFPQSQIDIFAASVHEQNTNLEKYIQTLNIYVTDPSKRASAYKQLSEKLGDAETLVQLNDFAPFEKEKLADLRLAIKVLTKRLNEAAKNASK